MVESNKRTNFSVEAGFPENHAENPGLSRIMGNFSG